MGSLFSACTRRAAAFLALLGMLALGSPAFSQIPSVLEEMTLVTQDAEQASFVLRFSPAEPQVAAINNNPRAPELLMRSALRAPRVPQQQASNSLVRRISFQNPNGDLVLRFDTSEPSRVKAEPAGPRLVQVTVSRVSNAEATGSRPLGSTGEVVVPATEIPAYAQSGAVNDTWVPGDAYELVPLKYADVSEIIGLLVEGETIQPNNVFIRREPGFGSPASTNQPNYVSAQNQAQRESVPLGQS